LLSFSDSWIGLFQNGNIYENNINTSISRIDRLASRQDEIYYALDRSTATIYRFTVSPFTIDWTLQVQVPSTLAQRSGEILVRESDEALIYYDDEQVFLIGDMGTEGTIINKKKIGDGTGLYVEATGELNPDYTFLRWRQALGEEILWSSSSSSSSSLSSVSDPSSSSSSFGLTSSSSSSSIGYSSSSSSLGESSSSSSGGKSSSSSSSLDSSSSSSNLSSSSSSSSLDSSSSSSSFGFSSESSASEYNSWECVAGANCVHFDNWVLNGTNDTNTDNGTLYAYTYRASPWTTRAIWIYKSSSHPTSAPFADPDLVASTSWTGAPSTSLIISQNGSGISGSVDILSTFYTNESLTLFGSV